MVSLAITTSYDMLQLIAAVACVAAGTLFITVFGITGITADNVKDFSSRRRIGVSCPIQLIVIKATRDLR
jgi:hypothetical protein